MARVQQWAPLAVGTLVAVAVAVAHAEWYVLTQSGLLMGVTAFNSTIMATGSADNAGGDIIRSDDYGTTWYSPLHDQQMLYTSIDSADGLEGIAGSLGFFGQTAASSVTEDGKTWTGIDFHPFVSTTLSVSSAGNGSSFMVGYWFNGVVNASEGDGVLAITQGGAVVSEHDWNQAYPSRYGAFPAPDVWFVSGGAWPLKKQATVESARAGDLEIGARFTLRRTAQGGPVTLDYHPPAAAPKGDRLAREPGWEGVIARSTDGGQSFQVVYADSERFYFNAIDCPSVTHCWAVTEGPEGGWIVATADGGATWTEQAFVASAGFFTVKMLNPLEGWAAGGIYNAQSFESLFLSTHDGGATWVSEPAIPHAFINGLALVDMTHVYATTFLRAGGSTLMAYRE